MGKQTRFWGNDRIQISSRSIFSENLVAIGLRKLEVKFEGDQINISNKYMCILDMSKTSNLAGLCIKVGCNYAKSVITHNLRIISEQSTPLIVRFASSKR